MSAVSNIKHLKCSLKAGLNSASRILQVVWGFDYFGRKILPVLWRLPDCADGDSKAAEITYSFYCSPV